MKFLRAGRAIETLEAAITFPIAILVMLAIVNLGVVVYGQQAVQAAARHGREWEAWHSNAAAVMLPVQPAASSAVIPSSKNQEYPFFLLAE